MKKADVRFAVVEWQVPLELGFLAQLF